MLKISVSIYHFPTPNGFCVGTWQRSSVTRALGCPAPYPLRHCHRTPRWQNVTQRTSATASLPSAMAGSTAGGEGILHPLGTAGASSAPGGVVPVPPVPPQPGRWHGHSLQTLPWARRPLPSPGSVAHRLPWCRGASCSRVAGPLLAAAAGSHPWRGAPARQVMLELSA